MNLKPTLKEVKKHFENAKEVKCLEENKPIDISKNIIRNIHYWCDGYWIDLDQDFHEGGSVYLWDEEKGYAEIVSYKETTYTLTKEQLKSLTDPQVKEWFPEVFVLPKDFTGWVLDEEYPNVIAYSENGYLKFGFDANCNWVENSSTKLRSERKATEAEVFEALKNEAVKRGFCSYGIYFKDTLGREAKTTSKVNIHNSSANFGLTNGDNMWFFRNGVWAEIIPTITRAEAEKELNKKIVD